MPKDFQIHRLFPRRQRFQELPARFGGMSAPGPLEALPGGSSLQVGHKGKRASDEGYIQSHLLQNPLQGVAVRAPVGSVDVVSYGFRKGWDGTTEPVVENTGIYMPATGQVGIAGAGVQEALINSTGVTVKGNLVWLSGTANDGVMDHANSADRTYTFQDADGTVAFLTDVTSGSDLKFTATPGDTAINSLTDVTIFSRDVTGLAAGDQLIVEGWFQILNNSTAARTYTFNVDYDGAFSARIVTAALANHASELHWFHFSSVLTVFTSGQSEMMLELDGRTTAVQAGPSGPTMTAGNLDEKDWATTGSDLTGTVTVTVNIQSSSATATQTLRLRNATIRKVTPT